MELHDVAFKFTGWMWKNESHLGDWEKIFSMLFNETQKGPSNPLTSRTSGRNHCQVRELSSEKMHLIKET